MPSPRNKYLSGEASKEKSGQDNIDDAAAATAAADDGSPPRAKAGEDEPPAKKTNNDEESQIAVAETESKGGPTEPSKQASDPGEESERQASDDDATKKKESPTKKEESTNIGAKDKDKSTATSDDNNDASPSKALNEEATEEGSGKPSPPAGDDVASDKTEATAAKGSEPKSKDRKSSKKDEVKPSSSPASAKDKKERDKSAEKAVPPEKTPSTPITVHSPPKRADATIYYDDPEEKILSSKNQPVVAHAPPPGAAERVHRSEKNTPRRHTPPPVLDTRPPPAVQQARIPPKPIDTSLPLSPPVISKPPPHPVHPPVEGEVTAEHHFPINLPSPDSGLIQVPDSEVARTYSETIFPMKLYDMLCNPEFHHAVAWLPHGRSWKVLNKDVFMAEICPRYFSQTRYESFVRQVNGWGFKRMRREGPDRGSYYHAHFLRGYANMIDHMRRPLPGEKSRDVREEPDFYAVPDMPMLPQDRDRVAQFLAGKSKAGRPMGSTVKTVPGGGHLRSSYDEMALPQQGLEGQGQQSGAAIEAGQIPFQQMSGYNPYMSYPPMPMSPYGQAGPPMGYPPMMGYPGAYPPPYMYGDPSQFYGQQQARAGSQQALPGQQQVPGMPQAATQTLAATPSSAKRKRGKLGSEAEAATKKQRAELQNQQAMPAGAGQIPRYPPPTMGPGMGPPMGMGYYGGAPPASPYQGEAATRKQQAEPQVHQALPAGAGQVPSYPPPMGSGMAPPPMGMGYYGNAPPASPYRPTGSAPMMQGYGPAAPTPGTPQGGMPYAYPQPLSYPPVSGYGHGPGPQMPMVGDPNNMAPDPNNPAGPGAVAPRGAMHGQLPLGGQMGTSMHVTYNASQSGGPPPPAYPGPPAGPY